MRQLYICLALILSIQVSAQTKKMIDSKIDRVTVFLEGAQVQRSAKSSLVAGKSELVFTNISPAIDKQSIQVKTDDNITVLSVIHQQNYMKEQQKQDEIKSLEALKEAQVDKILLQRNILNVFKQEEILLTKNQQIGGANTGLKATDLKEAADFQRNRLTEVYQKQMETERSLKKMEAEFSKMNRQLTELNQKADISTSEIHVTVNTKEVTNGNFTLTYLVKQSGWYPTYDIRVKDISSPISLQYKANVFQSSGEDWKDIRLFLSTGNPNENGTRPVINPWYLKYTYAYQPVSNTIIGMNTGITAIGRILDDKGNPVAGASVLVKGTNSGVAADANGFFSVKMPAGSNTLSVSAVGMVSTEVTASSAYSNIVMNTNSQQLNEVVVIGYGSRDGADEGITQQRKELGYATTKIKAVDIERNKNIITTIAYQPTTTVYEIKDPYTVLNDGKTYMVDIDGYEVKALYEYYAAPKQDPDAYLTAKIADWQQLNLLPGEANLFFEGTFLGKTVLDVEHAGDTLGLSLGKDKGVAVKRTLLKDYSSRKFLGSNKTDARQYEIVVRNNKQQPISIIIEDQFPISTQKEIEVQGRSYTGAKLEDDSQKLTWQFTVDARKENKLNFSYEVKYPKEKTLQLE